MGSFGGHALPGSFFIIVGLYWTVQFYRKLFESMRPGGTPFVSSVTFTCDCDDDDGDVESLTDTKRLPVKDRQRRRRRCCCCRRSSSIDWEGVLKMFFALVGFIVEVTAAMVDDGQFTAWGNGQHATMFFFFGLSGAVDVMVRAGSPLLPPGSEYLFGVLAFVVEALLFMFHLHGRSPMDVLVHTLLIYVLYATIAVVIVEGRFRRSPIVLFTRALLLIVQGTWFWQVGFILYKPLPGSVPWNQEDHGQIMVVTLMFAWLLAAVVTVMILIGALVHATCYRGVGVNPPRHRHRLHRDDDDVTPGRYRDDHMQLLSVKSSTATEYRDDELDSDFDSNRDRQQEQQQPI